MEQGLYVDLCVKRTHYRRAVHQLVAHAFLPDPPGACVKHKDGDVKNNCVDNLQYASGKASKPVVCIETGKVYESLTQATRETGVLQPTISGCCYGDRKTAGGYHWRFADESN